MIHPSFQATQQKPAPQSNNKVEQHQHQSRLNNLGKHPQQISTMHNQKPARQKRHLQKHPLRRRQMIHPSFHATQQKPAPQSNNKVEQHQHQSRLNNMGKHPQQISTMQNQKPARQKTQILSMIRMAWCKLSKWHPKSSSK